MPRPPKLRDDQREALSRLEPALSSAAKHGRYQEAKRLTARIQRVLRPTGHETRLMRAKNWLFEAAIDAGELQTAISGLTGVLQKTRPSTRVHLEAAALLAIAHLRRQDLDSASPLITRVLLSQENIRSEARRRQFMARTLERFEQEGLLAALKGTGTETLEPTSIEEEAARLVAYDPNTLYARIGETVPAQAVDFMLRIDKGAKLQLPSAEVKYLPSPQDLKRPEELGRRVFEPIQRFVWRSLCDPDGPVLKAWKKGGYSKVIKQVYIGSAVALVLTNLGLATLALAAPIAALIIQIGVARYCEKYEPKTVMISRTDKR